MSEPHLKKRKLNPKNDAPGIAKATPETPIQFKCGDFSFTLPEDVLNAHSSSLFASKVHFESLQDNSETTTILEECSNSKYLPIIVRYMKKEEITSIEEAPKLWYAAEYYGIPIVWKDMNMPFKRLLPIMAVTNILEKARDCWSRLQTELKAHAEAGFNLFVVGGIKRNAKHPTKFLKTELGRTAIEKYFKRHDMHYKYTKNLRGKEELTLFWTDEEVGIEVFAAKCGFALAGQFWDFANLTEELWARSQCKRWSDLTNNRATLIQAYFSEAAIGGLEFIILYHNTGTNYPKDVFYDHKITLAPDHVCSVKAVANDEVLRIKLGKVLCSYLEGATFVDNDVHDENNVTITLSIPELDKNLLEEFLPIYLSPAQSTPTAKGEE